MPVNRLLSGVPRIHLALSVAQLADESGGGLLAEDIRVRQPPAATGLLNCFRQPARQMAKELMAIVDDFVDSEGLGSVRLGWRRQGRSAHGRQAHKPTPRHFCLHGHPHGRPGGANRNQGSAFVTPTPKRTGDPRVAEISDDRVKTNLTIPKSARGCCIAPGDE